MAANGAGESSGVVTCISNIAAAYYNGSSAIQKIKSKRAQQKAPPPSRVLEETMDQAPQEIEKEKRRGIQRFGQAFEDGDSAAVTALQSIANELQASLIDPLSKAALHDDDATDFNELFEAADECRDQTVSALIELRKRLAAVKPAAQTQLPTQSSDPPSRSNSAHETSPKLTRAETMDGSRKQFSPPMKNAKTWTREYSVTKDDGGGDDAASLNDDSQPSSFRKSRGSLLGFLKHNRTASGGPEAKPIPQVPQLPPAPEEPSRQSSTATTMSMSMPYRTTSQQEASDSSSQKQQEWEGNPDEIWGPKPNQERRGTLSIAPDASMPPLSPALTHRTNSSFQTSVPNPSPDNEFLGFCKGAWKLQNGDRKGSLQKTKETDAWSRHPSAQANAYLACTQSRCAFRSTANVDSIWQKAWNVPAKGLKFRWIFLAKSHVAQKVVVKNQFTFQCLFCVFLGEKTKVFNGMNPYFDHLSREHRRQALGEVILYKTQCINDHEAADDEEFDVNLYPLNADPVDAKGVDDEFWADPTRRGTEAADSMFNEPWNEGLSDFHYGGGEFDRGNDF